MVGHLGRLHGHHDERAAIVVTGRTRAVALTILCLCALTAGIDMTITNIALPSIGHALDAPINELQWTVDAYNIVLAGLLVLGGGLADRYGRRRIFLLSFALFGIASAVAATSGGATQLIAARALMGVGAAGFTAPALAIIATMYSPEERGRAISVFVVFGASGLAIGPIVGGILLDHFWWGSVFMVNVPIVALGVAAGARTIRESRAPVPSGGLRPLDGAGAALSVLGLSALLFGIIEGPTRGWTAASVITGLVVGTTALVGFVRRELRTKAPLFDVRIVRDRAVAVGAVTLFVAYVMFDGFLFVNPQYLHDVRNESIVTVGLLLVPFAVVFGICSTQAGKVLARLGPRATISLGLMTSAGAAALMAGAVGGTTLLTVAASSLLGAGLSLLIAPPSTVVMNALPPEKAGDGSSLNFVSRFVGAAVGVAVVGSVLASRYAAGLAGAVAGLDPAEAEKARGSIQGALEVATTLPDTARTSLTLAAADGFDTGATVAYLTIAGLGALAAGWAWFALRDHATDARTDPRR